MAKLFKDKRIKKALEDVEIPQLEEKIAKIRKWHDAYQSRRLHEKTETQCEQAYNQDFFIDILGYTPFPEENYTIDPKANTESSGQKPDAVLGFFGENKRVVAVVEIKDVRTPLDKSQQRSGNLSPIQQGFKYKPQYKGCDFVIVTNFFETRLFKDNQLDYESFTLTDLVNPENNYFQFRKFYYLLCQKNFAPTFGESETQKLLAGIRIEQEKITKKFYADYKDLRKELIKNIVKNNDIPKHEFATKAVEKAQKIIDRIVFISFCEDLDLLPEDKLQEVVLHTEKMGLELPIWDVMKSFFNAIDKGSEKMGIPEGYNGELFKADPELERLRIDDEVCKKFVDFGKYDFSEDLSVNILGHIFEQSISDIEEIKRVGEVENGNKTTSKRKKEGIFYTPDYIVDYIVKNSLGAYLEEKEQKIKDEFGLKEDIKDAMYSKRLLQAYEKYQQELQSIKVLDPACGSGAFLVKVFDYLLQENKRVADVIADLEGGATSIFNTEAYFKEILQNNIYGVDLNEESVEITKLSLWLKTAQKGRKLATLTQNIKCGNSLIDDPEVAGDKAFDWNKEFSHIMKNGGFDVIVGNPPYVKLQNMRHLEKDVNYLIKTYRSSQTGNFDLYLPFIEKSFNLSRSNGYIAFIAPSVWIKNQYGKGLRDFVFKNKALCQFLDFGSFQVFEDATTYTAIQMFKKQPNDFFYFTKNEKQNLEILEWEKCKYKTLQTKESWSFVPEKAQNILTKMDTYGIPLISITKGIIVGVQTSADEIYLLQRIKKNEYYSKFKEKIVHIEDDLMKPLAKGKDAKKYETPNPKTYILFPYKIEGNDSSLFTVSEMKSKFPLGWIYLCENETYLRSREKGKMNHEQWYGYNYPKNINKQHIKKLGVAQTVSSLQVFADLDGDFVFHNVRVNGILESKDSKVDLLYIMALLNSKALNFYFVNTAKPKDNGFYEANKQFIAPLPISIAKNQQPYIERVIKIIDLQKNISSIKNRFFAVLKEDFKLTKLPRKVENFWTLSFPEFIKSLKLEKKSLSEKEELNKFFERNKNEMENYYSQTDNISGEIDNMVFDLYKFTPEERQIVLENS